MADASVNQALCPQCGSPLVKTAGSLQCNYCPPIIGNASPAAKDAEIERLLSESQQCLDEADQQLNHISANLHLPTAQKHAANEPRPSDFPTYASYLATTAANPTESKSSKYTDARLALAPLLFFTPIIWFLWDVAGATLCRLFNWQMVASFQPFFSPIFGHAWLVRFGVIAGFYTLLIVFDEKVLRKGQRRG